MAELHHAALIGRRILIVAENATADLMATVLRIEGAVTGKAEDLQQARVALSALTVDAVVLDFNVDLEAAVLQFIGKGVAGIPYVVFAPPSIDAAVRAMQAGAADVVNDRHGPAGLVSRLEQLTLPRTMRPRVALPPLQRFRLTQREREVLELIVKGLTNPKIGAKLKISVRTVELHRARVMKKAGAHNLAELMRAVMGPR